MNVGFRFVCVHKHSWFFLGCLVSFVLKIFLYFLYAIFKVHKNASAFDLESCGMFTFLSDYKFKCIGTQCHDRGNYVSEVRILSGLKWTRTTDLTLIRRAL